MIASEREVRDLPCIEFRTTVVIEVYRVKCPDCGVKVGESAAVAGQGPLQQAVRRCGGLACESASARQVARRFGLPASTVRAIDLRYLERWAAARRKPVLRQMGVDEIHLGKTEKFLTVVSNLDSREPLWFGRERKKETLDEFFQTELRARQRRGSRPPAWICGNPSGSASSSGRRTAGSSTTSSTSCNMPTRP